MKEQLSILDKVDGNVDSISNRIANVRTWSYVSNKNGWVENQDYWIKRTKSLEDKLSDRLHEELTKSFIDKRASVLARGLKQDISFKTKIEDDEKVLINNFNFQSTPSYFNNGIVNERKFLLKNVNSKGKNSKNFEINAISMQ